MNEKCAMNSIKNNIKFIGILLLSFILIITIGFFCKNVMNSHSNIIEKYGIHTAKDLSNNYGRSYNFPNNYNPTDKKTLQDNNIKFRKCQVYFVGDNNRNSASPYLWRKIDKIEENYVKLDMPMIGNALKYILTYSLNDKINKDYIVLSANSLKWLNNKYGNIESTLKNELTIYSYVQDSDGNNYMPIKSNNELIQDQCDKRYEIDNKNPCKYEYEDGWMEIDEINGSKFDKKIYNKSYTNKIEQPYMKSCFKKTNGNPKYYYNSNDLVKFDYSGVNNINSLSLNELSDDTGISRTGNYINMRFNESDNLSNYNNIINNICSMKYRHTNLQRNLKFIRFNLTTDNKLVKGKEADIVRLNHDNTGFYVVTDDNNIPAKPKFLKDSLYGMMLESYVGDTLIFNIFKNSSIPIIDGIEVYKFNYNYLCDGKITEYLKMQSKLKLANLVVPPEPAVQISDKKVIIRNIPDLRGFNWNNFKSYPTLSNPSSYVDQKQTIVNALNQYRDKILEEIENKYNNSQISEGFSNFSLTGKYGDKLNEFGLDELKSMKNKYESQKDRQIKKQNDDLTQTIHRLSGATGLKKQSITDIWGNKHRVTDTIPFNFKKGFFMSIEYPETLYNPNTIYGSLKALNENAIKYSLAASYNLGNKGLQRKTINTNHHWRGDIHPRGYVYSGGYWARYTCYRWGYSWWRRRWFRYRSSCSYWRRRYTSKWNLTKNRGYDYNYTKNTTNMRRGGNYYGHYYHGKFIAPYTGYYQWRIDSDDGSHLVINGRHIVNNGGLHGMRARWRSYHMKEGEIYTIEATMAEHGGGDNMHIFWRTPKYNGYRWNASITGNINGQQRTFFYNSATKIAQQKYTSKPKWQLVQGEFVAKVEAASGRDIDLEDITFAKRKLNSMPQTSDGVNWQEIIFDKSYPEDDYYQYYFRGNSKKIEFKISQKGLALKEKAKYILGTQKNEEGETIIDGHIDILNNNNLYYNISNNDVRSSIPGTAIIKPFKICRFVITGYIFLESGYYNFKVDTGIPTKVVEADYKFKIASSIQNAYEKSDIDGYTIKVNIGGFYKYSYNCYVVNNQTKVVSEEQTEEDLREIATAKEEDRKLWESEMKELSSITEEEQAYLDDPNVPAEQKKLIRKDVEDRLKQIKTDSENEFQKLMQQHNEFKFKEVGIQVFPKFVLTLDFKSLLSDNAVCNNISANNLLFAGKSLFTKVNDQSWGSMFLNIKGFNREDAKCSYTKTTESFSNYDNNASIFMENFNLDVSSAMAQLSAKSKVKESVNPEDSAANAESRRLAILTKAGQELNKQSANSETTPEFTYNNSDIKGFLDNNSDDAKDMHWLNAIKTNINKIDDLIEKREAQKLAERRTVNVNFDNVISRIQSSRDYKNYFTDTKIEYRNNVDITTLINNSSGITSGPGEQKEELLKYVTNEKIKNINKRTTSDIQNYDYNNYNHSAKSYYVLAESIFKTKDKLEAVDPSKSLL